MQGIEWHNECDGGSAQYMGQDKLFIKAPWKENP